MNEKIRRLSNKCKGLANGIIYNKDMYNEIIELIINGNYDEEDKLSLLIELYRYAFYSNVRISISPDGDRKFKYYILVKIQNDLSKNTLSKELIEFIEKNNDIMREHIDSPIEFIEEEIKFYSKNPKARF